jgi:alpha-tubulin suppressor-like RCC1 family protein
MWANYIMARMSLTAVCCIFWLAQCVPALAAEGYVIQWGWNSGTATPTPARLVASNAVAVSAGAFHSLALRADGTVYGWGFDLNGMVLGTPLPQPGMTSGIVRINGQLLSNVVSVAAGRAFSIALKKDGTVATWGENYVPKDLTNVVGIAADCIGCWALKRDGKVVGWSSKPTSHDYGRLLSMDQLSNVVRISAGPFGHGTRGVALRSDSTVATWGSESIHMGYTAPPDGLSNVVAIAAGASHSLALRGDGTVMGWGSNKAGEATGTPTTNSPNNLDFISAGPVRVGGEILTGVVSIAAGTGYSLALRKDGTVVAWGRMFNDLYPVTVPEGLSNVVAIAAGWGGVCLAITTNKEVAERFRH